MPGFVDLSGASKKSRPITAVNTPTISSEEVSDPDKLAKILKDLLTRVSSLETVKPSLSTEYEVSCPASGTVKIQHGLNCPVRWSITSWKGAASHNLRQDETNTDLNTLFLTSGAAGRATIAISQSQFALTKGAT